MPSPIGHALAGIAAGCVVAGPRTALAPPRRRRLALFALLGMLADIDLLFGLHSTYTHSLGAAVLVGVAAALAGGRHPLRLGAAAAAAWGSHVLLDWLGADDAAPYGILALWPLSDAWLLSDRHWFLAVCREYAEARCWLHNARGLLRELVLLLPVTAAVLLAAARAYRR